MIYVNVFISHSWSYSEHYETLAAWLFDQPWGLPAAPQQSVQFIDWSVPRDDPIHSAPNSQALQDAILQRIANSRVVIIPTGMYANHSDWIGKEIAGARQFQRPILAVDPWGAQRTSSIVQNNATETVGWRKQSVGDGVWRLAQ